TRRWRFPSEPSAGSSASRAPPTPIERAPMETAIVGSPRWRFASAAHRATSAPPRRQPLHTWLGGAHCGAPAAIARALLVRVHSARPSSEQPLNRRVSIGYFLSRLLCACSSALRSSSDVYCAHSARSPSEGFHIVK